MKKSARDISNEEQLIANFVGDMGLLNYQSLDRLDKVIHHIQKLGYSFQQISFISKDTVSHTAAFWLPSEPFNSTQIVKAKSRLEAIYELCLKFIKEYEPIKKEVD